MATKNPGELSVILKAKELFKYMNIVTKKMPKEYRFTYKADLRRLSVEVIEELYMANEVYVSGPSDRAAQQLRRDRQHLAMTKVRLICFFAQTALEEKAILLKQYEMISRLSFEILNLIGAWLRSDRRRYQYDRPQMQNGRQSF